jgi:hypothetical protein
MAWDTQGHQVDVTLTALHRAVRRDDISAEFTERYDNPIAPPLFTSCGTLKQIYMGHLPRNAGVFLLDTANLIDEFEDALLKQGPGGKKIDKMTRDALVKARMGQGKFRSNRLRDWGSQCSLTGLSNTDPLVVSHIHAWSLCDNDARIYPYTASAKQPRTFPSPQCRRICMTHSDAILKMTCVHAKWYLAGASIASLDIAVDEAAFQAAANDPQNGGPSTVLPAGGIPPPPMGQSAGKTKYLATRMIPVTFDKLIAMYGALSEDD